MRTLPIELSCPFNQEGASQWGLVMAATIVVILPVLLLFLQWQKHTWANAQVIFALVMSSNE